MARNLLENWIVLEGLDGSGTTTQKNLLHEWLTRLQMNSIATCEPTDGPIGKLIRSYLRKEIRTTPFALATLYAADREDHLNNPETGLAVTHHDAIIISDRYFYSSLAYQSVSIPYETVELLNQYPHPRFLVYIDTPVDVCIERMRKRNAKAELFEYKEYLEVVTAYYEKAFASLPGNVIFKRFDGQASIEQTLADIQSFLFSCPEFTQLLKKA